MPASKGLYSVHPGVAHVSAILDNLPGKTGRSVQEWVRLLEAEGPQGSKDRRAWLKKNHGLGGTTISMIVDWAEGRGLENMNEKAYLEAAAEWVEALYAEAKSALRPIHDALVGLGLGMGADVKVCPCRTIVPFYRKHVFAQIKPSTRTRIDFGLALKGASQLPPAGLLETGGLQKGDRITHRFPISSLDEIDDEVKRWLRIAYGLDA